MQRSFGASPTESCNLLSLLPVGVGDDLGDRLRLLWRRSGRGSPQRRGLGPRPSPALEYQVQSEYNHYDQGAVEKGLDWFLIVNATVLLLARATQFLSTRAVADDSRFLLQQTARVDLPTRVARVERGRVRAGLEAPPLGQNFKPPRRGYLGQDFRSDERQIPERVLGL